MSKLEIKISTNFQTYSLRFIGQSESNQIHECCAVLTLLRTVIRLTMVYNCPEMHSKLDQHCLIDISLLS